MVKNCSPAPGQSYNCDKFVAGNSINLQPAGGNVSGVGNPIREADVSSLLSGNKIEAALGSATNFAVLPPAPSSFSPRPVCKCQQLPRRPPAVATGRRASWCLLASSMRTNPVVMKRQAARSFRRWFRGNEGGTPRTVCPENFNPPVSFFFTSLQACIRQPNHQPSTQEPSTFPGCWRLDGGIFRTQITLSSTAPATEDRPSTLDSPKPIHVTPIMHSPRWLSAHDPRLSTAFCMLLK